MVPCVPQVAPCLAYQAGKDNSLVELLDSLGALGLGPGQDSDTLDAFDAPAVRQLFSKEALSVRAREVPAEPMTKQDRPDEVRRQLYFWASGTF